MFYQYVKIKRDEVIKDDNVFEGGIIPNLGGWLVG